VLLSLVICDSSRPDCCCRENLFHCFPSLSPNSASCPGKRGSSYVSFTHGFTTAFYSSDEALRKILSIITIPYFQSSVSAREEKAGLAPWILWVRPAFVFDYLGVTPLTCLCTHKSFHNGKSSVGPGWVRGAVTEHTVHAPCVATPALPSLRSYSKFHPKAGRVPRESRPTPLAPAPCCWQSQRRDVGLADRRGCHKRGALAARHKERPQSNAEETQHAPS